MKKHVFLEIFDILRNMAYWGQNHDMIQIFLKNEIMDKSLGDYYILHIGHHNYKVYSLEA